MNFCTPGADCFAYNFSNFILYILKNFGFGYIIFFLFLLFIFIVCYLFYLLRK